MDTDGSTEPDPKFLCAGCAACMCDDCKSIAGEYADLFEAQKLRLMALETKVARLRSQLDSATRLVQYWQEVAQLGIPAVIQAWMNSIGPEKVVKSRR